MRTVGVRQLPQDASESLDWVEATGDSIEITNHGRPVARLVPITRTGGIYADLVAAGATVKDAATRWGFNPSASRRAVPPPINCWRPTATTLRDAVPALLRVGPNSL